MYKITDTDKELEKMIEQQKSVLSLSFKKNFDTQEKTLELFVKGINHADFNRFNNTRLIWNIAGFINIVSLDLKVVGKDLYFAENEWQKRYYARQACLIIYESLNDISDLLGRDFKTLISKKFIDNTFEGELKIIRVELNLFKSAYFVRLKEIRNISIAHRDNDIMKQIDLIKNISWSEIFGVISKFDNILNSLGQSIQKLINNGINELDEIV